MNISRFSRIDGCERGTSAVEFALIAPVFVSFLFGILVLSLTAFSASGLQTAVEIAARCSSLDSSTCGTSATTVAFAQSKYSGLGTPTFTSTTASCGHSVNASLALTFGGLLSSYAVPLSAAACFP
jgi:Flp pilus assembly protein TadG